MYATATDRYEKRGARRHDLDVPVIFPSGRGRTRDMSGTGVYFETSSEVEMGPINFSIALDVVSEDVELIECTGQVIRIEEKPTGRGVAVRIDSMEL